MKYPSTDWHSFKINPIIELNRLLKISTIFSIFLYKLFPNRLRKLKRRFVRLIWFNLIWLGFMAYQLLIFNVKSYLYVKSDQSRGWTEGSPFDSYYTKVYGRVLLISLDCSTLPLILTVECWVLSKEASSTIFWIFGMTGPGIEPRSPGPLAITRTILPLLITFWNKQQFFFAYT